MTSLHTPNVQPSKLPPSPLILSLTVSVQLPFAYTRLTPACVLLGSYVAPPVGGHGHDAEASSSKPRSKSSSPPHERCMISTLVPAGLRRKNWRSLIHVCLPCRFTTLISRT